MTDCLRHKLLPVFTDNEVPLISWLSEVITREEVSLTSHALLCVMHANKSIHRVLEWCIIKEIEPEEPDLLRDSHVNLPVILLYDYFEFFSHNYVRSIFRKCFKDEVYTRGEIDLSIHSEDIINNIRRLKDLTDLFLDRIMHSKCPLVFKKLLQNMYNAAIDCSVKDPIQYISEYYFKRFVLKPLSSPELYGFSHKIVFYPGINSYLTKILKNVSTGAKFSNGLESLNSWINESHNKVRKYINYILTTDDEGLKMPDVNNEVLSLALQSVLYTINKHNKQVDMSRDVIVEKTKKAIKEWEDQHGKLGN